MESITQINLADLISSFPHKTTTKVQFFQVDSFQILHNIQYLYLFENARLEYLQTLGLADNLNVLIKKFPVMTVHHSIDYYSPAYFNDLIEVYTKVKEIGKSSIRFENIAITGSKLLARAETVYVYVNPLTGDSQPFPEEIKVLFS